MIRADSINPEVWESMCTPMHEILPSSGRTGALYLGSWAASVDNELLATHHIRAIVEVHDSPWGSSPLPTPSSPMRALSSYGFEAANGGSGGGAPGQIGRYKVAIADRSDADLLKPYLDGVVRYIKDRLSRGENVLVHCQQGVSRSPAIVIAFLLQDRGMSYDNALKIVRSKRKCSKPNAGFERTLREWETTLRR